MLRFFVIFGVFIMLTACTTQKRKGEASGLKKQYHNTTSYYNGFFNADLLIDESIVLLETQHKDNYNKVLDMYKYTAADNPQAVYPSLDKAIEKLVTVVHLHRVADWTDDCYLQIGKSQYLKQDYESAQETLEYFMQEFTAEGKSKSLSKNTKKKTSKGRSAPSGKKQAASKAKDKETKKLIKERNKQIKTSKKSKKVNPKDAKAIREARKQAKDEQEKGPQPKVEEVKNVVQEEEGTPPTENFNKTLSGEDYKPKSYFMKHKPCYQEGQLWLARTYVERQNYDNARMYIKQLENDKGTFQEIRSECAAVEAYSYMKQKNYNLAVLPLRKAIELSNKKKDKARFMFILGQLFELTGNYADAADAFEKCIKYHYSPEMDFYAQLRVLVNKSKSSGRSESLVKEVERMLKERKYSEYRDQLYYSLGMMSLEKGDRKKGVEQLENALKQPNGSRQNQAEIYYVLANVYFEDEDYVQAKKYYDNAINALPKTDERRPECERKARSIAEIASNLAVVLEQDSLLKIADMSDEEKLALAQRIKKEKQSEELNAEKNNDAPKNAGSGTFYTSGSRPLFFAYDQKNVKRNQKDFERKWGNRPLEDDWRRSQRSQAGAGAEDLASQEGSSSGKMTVLEMQDILKGIPDNPGAVGEANDKILEALFNLGGLFRDKMDRPDLSLRYLDQLEARFPGNHQEAHAFYLSYLDHLDLGNKQKAEMYRQRIISEHSESIYAAVLNDPNYLKKKKEEENKLKTYYASTFDYFTKGDYEKAYQMSSESAKLFGNNNELRSKFALINAMSTGNLKGVDEYMQALREVVAKYPNTEEQTRAREILRLLGQRVPSEEVSSTGITSGKDSSGGGSQLYKPEPDEQHYVLIVLKENGLSLNDAKIKASDFNRLYFSLEQLKVSNIVIGANNQTPVLVVRRFDNQKAAMKYYDAITKNRKDFYDDVTQYEIYAISQNNYRTLVANRSADSYRDFFIHNYLK